ncbi:MAG: hypothetical protein M1825_005479 [Sarcosagium campestre]|nr:MAG: hypothetical protein M1825_005479 [Sarcosagium campestre]
MPRGTLESSRRSTRLSQSASSSRRSLRTVRNSQSYREASTESSEQSEVEYSVSREVSEESGVHMRDEGSPMDIYEQARSNLQETHPSQHATRASTRQRNMAINVSSSASNKRRRAPSPSSTTPGSPQLGGSRRKKMKASSQISHEELQMDDEYPASCKIQNGVARKVTSTPWQSLPYHIWYEIFEIVRDSGGPAIGYPGLQQPPLKLLIRVARLCRAFYEPAISAVYHSPALLHLRPQYLLAQLEKPQGDLMVNYRTKVKRLEIEIKSTFRRWVPGDVIIPLNELIRFTPQLRDLELYHEGDRPPFRFTLGGASKWTYPADLFQTLDDCGIRLRSWRWNILMFRNSLMIEPPRRAAVTPAPEDLRDIHLRRAFQSLRRLALVNFRVSTAPPRSLVRLLGETAEDFLAVAIKALPNLDHLEFESCDIANETLLPQLPEGLRSLSLINCERVTSEHLQSFLYWQGRELRSLTLNHNQSLSLSFLPDLAVSCPKLETFVMDLNYFDPRFDLSPNNNQPHYQILMLPRDVPTWPRSLQVLELTHLRNWNVEIADMFFGSLTEAAQTLPNLRRLVLRAILKTGWRDRANFRDAWMRKLNHVFLRKTNPPDPHMSSLRSRMGQQSMVQVQLPRKAEMSTDDFDGDEHDEMAPITDIGDIMMASSRDVSASNGTATRRRSSRISRPVHLDEDSANEGSERPVRLTRVVAKRLQQYPGDPGGEVASRRVRFDDKVPRQGMCDVVDVRIDNLRPRQNHFDEGDFLDDEASGDEDWDGDDMDLDDERYAW